VQSGPHRKVLLATGVFISLAAVAFIPPLLRSQTEIPKDEFSWVSRPYTPEAPSAPAIRVRSDLVEVPVVVLDSHEKPVPNLKKEDFLLFDNGKPQTISAFSVLTGAAGSAPAAATAAPGVPAATAPSRDIQPRYVALFFDDMSTTMPNLTFAREAAIKFIRKGLDPGERIGIFTASGSLSLDFTDNLQRLLDTLAKLRVFQRMQLRLLNPCPPETKYQAWVIIHSGGETEELVDAAAAAVACCGPGGGEACAREVAESMVDIDEGRALDTIHALGLVIRHLSQMPGHRVVVLTSSGFLALSLHQETQKVIESALRGNVVINSLDSSGVVYDDKYKTHFNMKAPMYDLAAGTGGKLIQNSNDLAAGMHTLASPPPVSYVLGFTPENLKVDGSAHSLQVKLTNAERFAVHARPDYYAPSPDPSPSEKRFNRLQATVLSADGPAELPIELTATPAASATGDRNLNVSVHVDTHKLPFADLNDERKVERLIFITALFDAKSQFVAGVEGVMDLRIKAATLKKVREDGLDAKLTVQAPAGSYRLRQVVQEAIDGKIAALDRPVEIH